jgi:hypothetical protein
MPVISKVKPQNPAICRMDVLEPRAADRLA